MINPAEDELGRDRVGFADTMSDLALYDANHGCWKLGPRANREKFMLVTFTGIVRQAIEITGIEAVARGNRSVVHGDILRPCHPVFDKFIGKQSPIQGVRNPVTYFDDDLDGRPCLCGCGNTVAGRLFLTGHDQTAIHDRIKQIGSVAEFLAWFDIVRGNKPGQS